jgi:outer membrane protein OmpA-like peptidoglycan-associated protein
MRSGPALVSALLALTSAAWAVPGAYGLRGLPSVIDARVQSQGSYWTAVWFMYQSAAMEDSLHFAPPAVPSIDTVLWVEDTEHYADARIDIGYGIRPDLEAAVSIRAQLSAYQYEQVEPRGSYVGLMDMVWGFTDISASVKYTHQLREDMHLAGIARLSIPTAEAIPDTAADYDGYFYDGSLMLQVRRPYLGTGGFSYGLTGAFTYLYDILAAHANLGFTMYGLKTTDPILGPIDQTDPAVEFAIGAEAATPLVSFYAETAGRVFPGRSSDPGYSSPMWLDLGFRIIDSGGAWLDALGRIGLSGFDREESDPYATGNPSIPEGLPGDAGFALCIGFDSGLRGGAGDQGWIAGTVTDASSGAAMTATISFPGSAIQPVRSDPATGFFRVSSPTGTTVVQADAEGFVPITVTVEVRKGATSPADFRMGAGQTSQPAGTVSGMITDAAEGTPVRAMVTDTGSGTSTTAGQDGAYSVTIPAGARVLQVQAAGYAAATRNVEVPEGGAVQVSFQLARALETGQVMSFANIYFDSGSATLKQESFPVLDDIADLLIANPGSRVEVGGHTDSDGSDSFNQSLSERRAASVRDYLVSRGVPASMLTTMGYGEARPVASNSTPQGKAQNRRIEFRVL